MKEQARDLKLLREALARKAEPKQMAAVEVAPLGPELKAAEVKFLQAGLPCEIISRGAGLEPWLKLALPTGDVHVAHQYNRIVSTDRIPGFNTSTAGLGEFEYYVEV